MAATRRQIHIYQFHRRNCQEMGIPQSTLHHKSLQGSLGTPSATGNVVYTGPVATTAAPATVNVTDTSVWMVTEPIDPGARGRPGDETEIGRQDLPVLKGQFPAIDDNSALVSVAHDDLVTDAAGIIYRLADPAPTPDYSMWTFTLKRYR